jgi:hypothetical protein
VTELELIALSGLGWTSLLCDWAEQHDALGRVYATVRKESSLTGGSPHHWAWTIFDQEGGEIQSGGMTRSVTDTALHLDRYVSRNMAWLIEVNPVFLTLPGGSATLVI